MLHFKPQHPARTNLVPWRKTRQLIPFAPLVAARMLCLLPYGKRVKLMKERLSLNLKEFFQAAVIQRPAQHEPDARPARPALARPGVNVAAKSSLPARAAQELQPARLIDGAEFQRKGHLANVERSPGRRRRRSEAS